jgi:uncharacterized protein YdbL (DUF1318 family)
MAQGADEENMMARWVGLPVSAVLLTACVTINVYFPAAEAKEAAREFVEKVIGDEAQAPDITIKTPAIQAIQARMAQRFDAQLRAGFDAGALGFAGDGTIVVRDAGKLPLKDRVAINSAVADDNRDRKAVYREVAVANGHPEWEDRIRDVFAKQWIDSARSGWWYQSGGAWKQK